MAKRPLPRGKYRKYGHCYIYHQPSGGFLIFASSAGTFMGQLHYAMAISECDTAPTFEKAVKKLIGHIEAGLFQHSVPPELLAELADLEQKKQRTAEKISIAAQQKKYFQETGFNRE